MTGEPAEVCHREVLATTEHAAEALPDRSRRHEEAGGEAIGELLRPRSAFVVDQYRHLGTITIRQEVAEFVRGAPGLPGRWVSSIYEHTTPQAIRIAEYAGDPELRQRQREHPQTDFRLEQAQHVKNRRLSQQEPRPLQPR